MSSMQMCPKCSQDNPFEAKVCRFCGTELRRLLGENVLLAGRYKLIRVLGYGGMGAVYLAEDINLLSTQRAIKENLDFSSEAQHQFVTEADLLIKLDHPSLPTVYDRFSKNMQVGKLPRQYIVMQYIEGKTLEEALNRQGIFPEENVISIAKNLLGTLIYLHNHSVVHRDIKPANIKVLPDGNLVLVDFGIAKRYVPEENTAAGARGVGSPGFAPIEQYGGGYGNTDARSDIYSLGAVMYFLLTGQIPPVAPDLINDSSLLTLPRKYRPNLSIHIEEIILKSMAIDPTYRYQSAGEMLDALTSFYPTPTKHTVLLSQKGIVSKPITIFPIEIPLYRTLDDAAKKIFWDVRGSIVKVVLRDVFRDVPITGKTITLTGYEKVGTTWIVQHIREETLKRQKSSALVVYFDMARFRESVPIIKEIFEELKQKGNIGGLNRKTKKIIVKAYRQYLETHEPNYKEKLKDKRDIYKLNLGVKISGTIPGLGTIDIGGPLGPIIDFESITHRESEPSLPITDSNEKDEENIITVLRSLIQYLIDENVKVTLIFDKINNVNLLAPLKSFFATRGLTTVLVVDKIYYDKCSESEREFFERPILYVSIVPDIAKRLVETLLLNSKPEIENYQYIIKYLEFVGQGKPALVIHHIFSHLDETPSKLPYWQRIWEYLHNFKRPPYAYLKIKESDIQRISHQSSVQLLLDELWPTLLDDKEQQTLIGKLGDEKQDKIRILLYETINWMLKCAEENKTDVPQKEFFNEIEKRSSQLGLNDSKVSKLLGENLLKGLVSKGAIKIKQKGRKFNPTGILNYENPVMNTLTPIVQKPLFRQHHIQQFFMASVVIGILIIVTTAGFFQTAISNLFISPIPSSTTFITSLEIITDTTLYTPVSGSPSIITPTSTSTKFLTSTPLPTHTPGATRASTISPTPFQTPVYKASAPKLEAPKTEFVVRGDKEVTFQWRWRSELDNNWGFEMRLWNEKSSEHLTVLDRNSFQESLRHPVRGVYQIRLQLSEVDIVRRYGPGKYYWTVAVIQLEPYERIGQEASSHKLIIKPSQE